MIALAIALTNAAYGAAYDPELTWRVITTDHFDIHFHQGEEQLADEFSTRLEAVYATMTGELRWEPRRRTQIVLVDRSDSANGFAISTPYNTIVIYVTAPQEDSGLGFYEDWSKTIATHEFTHILHLDAHHGIVTLARDIVGKVASTNQLSPLWMIEGLAVFEETRYTSGGRGRSPSVEAVLRTAVVDDAWPSLGTLDGFQVAPPGGNLRYLFGDDLIAYVADHHGHDVWTKWAHTYGSSVPYYLPGKMVFGEALPKLYRDWTAQRHADFEEQIARVEAEGLREGELVSDGASSCIAPSFSPDGTKIVWSCLDLRRGASILQADGNAENAEPILHDIGAKNFTWRSDSMAFVYAGTHIVNRFNTWSDIYLHELGSKGVVPLTKGARARDPEFTPDGTRLYVVTNHAQQNALDVMTVDQRVVPLTETDDHTQFSTPRASPDGRALAMSVWKDGRRDLWLYDLDGKPLRRLTADSATDRDPEWSADGKWLFFVSDRTGIANVYAIEVATERLVQWTNVRTTAAAPTVSPDGRWLVYEQYSADGWEIRRLDLHATTPIARGTLAAPIDGAPAMSELVGGPPVHTAGIASAWTGSAVKVRPSGAFEPPDAAAARVPIAQSAESLDTFEQTTVKDAFGAEKDYPFAIPPHRYTPLRTIAPTFWLPLILTTPYSAQTLKVLPRGQDANGDPSYYSAVISAFAGGTDTLRYVSWSADASYRSDADFLGYGGQVTISRWLPTYQIAARRSANPFGPLYLERFTGVPEPIPGPPAADPPARRTGIYRTNETYWDKESALSATISYPYTYKTTVFGRYSLVHRAELAPLPSNTYLPRVPARGWIGQIEGGWRYAWGKGTPYAISPEDSRSFSLIGGFIHPWLGTRVEDEKGVLQPITQVQLTSEVRQYWTNPWIPNHVLAVRLAGGVTIGPTQFFGNYRLGGPYGEGGYTIAPDETRMVRGYPLSADVGDMYWLGGLEYRFPIVHIDRGTGILPLFYRNISAAAFVDTGNAFTSFRRVGDAVDGTLVGVGGEVRMSGIIGWSVPVTLRAGMGVGLTGDLKYSAGERGSFYLLGGSSF